MSDISEHAKEAAVSILHYWKSDSKEYYRNNFSLGGFQHTGRLIQNAIDQSVKDIASETELVKANLDAARNALGDAKVEMDALRDGLIEAAEAQSMLSVHMPTHVLLEKVEAFTKAVGRPSHPLARVSMLVEALRGEVERLAELSERWEIGFRNIATFTLGPRASFDIEQVVNIVRELSGCDGNGDPEKDGADRVGKIIKERDAIAAALREVLMYDGNLNRRDPTGGPTLRDEIRAMLGCPNEPG